MRCGSEVWLHTRVLWGCKARCEILAGRGAGSDEHEDKESRRCRAPIIGFAAALQGRESPPNGLQLGKSTREMFGLRVVGEGMGRGNSESITANTMTSRPTNVTKTNLCPAFVAYRRKEICLYLATCCYAHMESHNSKFSDYRQVHDQKPCKLFFWAVGLENARRCKVCVSEKDRLSFCRPCLREWERSTDWNENHTQESYSV